MEELADGATALVLGLTAVLLGFAVALEFTFCLAVVVFVVELVVAGRAVVEVGLLAVAGFTVRLVEDEVLAGLAVALLVVVGRETEEELLLAGLEMVELFVVEGRP